METRLESESRKQLISECLKMEIELKRLLREWRVKETRNLIMKRNNKVLDNDLAVLQRKSLENDYNKVFAIKECKVVVRSDENCQENQFQTSKQLTINQNLKNACLNKQTNYLKKQYECQHPGCDKKVASRDGLRQHKNVHTKKFQCQVCQKCFTTSNSLQVHLRTHTGERPFACDWEGCGFRFTDKGNLKEHIKLIHSNDKPFHCNQDGCGKSFKLKRLLKDHLNFHTGKFQCEHCQKCLKSLYYLKRHLRTHTDERPFECDWNGCGKRLKNKESLDIHKKTKHSDERPFKCLENGCNKSFKMKKYLNNHIPYHSTDRPLQCPKEGCDKTFKTKNDLSQHVNFHIDVKKFKCEFEDCEKSFKTRGELKQHHRSHK